MHNFQMISYALPFFFQALFSVIRYILFYGESNVYRRMYQRYKEEKKLLNVLHWGLCAPKPKKTM